MRRLCQRPGCTGAAAAVLVIDVGRRLAVIADAGDRRRGVELCDRHADRITVPVGWTRSDRRALFLSRPGPEISQPELLRPLLETPPVPAVPAPPVAPPAATPPRARAAESIAEPAEPAGTLRHEVDERTPLLARAFRILAPGTVTETSGAGGFALLEGAHHEVDGRPEGLGERVEDERSEPGDDHPDHEQGHHGDLGGGEHEPDRQGDQQQPEDRDGVHAHGTDELPGATLEQEAAPGASVHQLYPPAEEVPAPADGAAEPGGPPEERSRGRRRGRHGGEGTDPGGQVIGLF
jgi:hypothetical protein